MMPCAGMWNFKNSTSGGVKFRKIRENTHKHRLGVLVLMHIFSHFSSCTATFHSMDPLMHVSLFRMSLVITCLVFVLHKHRVYISRPSHLFSSSYTSLSVCVKGLFCVCFVSALCLWSVSLSLMKSNLSPAWHAWLGNDIDVFGSRDWHNWNHVISSIKMTSRNIRITSSINLYRLTYDCRISDITTT